MADPIVTINTDGLPPKQISVMKSGLPLGGQPAHMWWSQQGQQLQRDFMKQISQSMTSGESIYQATTRIIGGTIKGVKVPGIMKVARSRAEALVRTEVNTIVTATRLQTLQEMSDVVKGIQQVSTLDSRTSDICIAYSGQAWDIETLKPLPPSTLPWNSGPPRHFNCRSTIVPVVKSAQELGIPLKELAAGTRASMDGQVPGDITFGDWLKKKGTAFQDELLGPARARLWREGKITLTQLVDMKGNPLSVEALEALAAKAPAPAVAAAATAAAAPAPTVIATYKDPELVEQMKDHGQKARWAKDYPEDLKSIGYTDEAVKAVDSYSLGLVSDAANVALRKSPDWRLNLRAWIAEIPWRKQYFSDVEETVFALDRAFATEVASLPRDYRLFRGMKMKADVQVGETFWDMGFNSWSASRSVAQEFAEIKAAKGIAEEGERTIFVLNAKKGTKALGVRGNHDTEAEILLPRGQGFKVLKIYDVQKSVDGARDANIRVVVVELDDT